MDEIYLRKVRDGDIEAFGYFLREYKDMGYTIAMSVLKDEHLSEEVVQDAFVKAFRNIASFAGQSKFSTWFYRIVTNEALMRLKKTKSDFLEFQAEYEEDIYDETTDLGIAEEDRKYLVNLALSRLSPRESLVLRLFYLEEERVRTISEITGWSEANVKVLLHRARKSMFTILRKINRAN